MRRRVRSKLRQPPPVEKANDQARAPGWIVKVATGLTRPDFFDWPAYLKGDIDKRTKPFDAVMLIFGANDGQDTKVDGKQLTFGSGSWKAMYAQRVGAVMDIYLKRGVKRV